jgi:D-alanine-D-alanine ligase
MGGKSGEREVSLRSGAGVLGALKRQGYDAVGIDVDEHTAEKLRAEKIEVAFLALHGKGGEDGAIQGLLQIMEIPYTGSGIQACAVSMDKTATKYVLDRMKIPYARTYIFTPGRGVAEQCAEMLKSLRLPIIVKPACEGSSLGCALIKIPEDAEREVAPLLARYPDLIAEEFIKGQDVTVGILGAGADARALPILELIPDNEFYDYEAKYTKGMTKFICPANLSQELTRKAQQLALDTHRALGCHGVSRVDIIVDPQGDCFVLELNSIPGMTETSDIPAEYEAAGGSYDELVVEILNSATLER